MNIKPWYIAIHFVKSKILDHFHIRKYLTLRDLRLVTAINIAFVSSCKLIQFLLSTLCSQNWHWLCQVSAMFQQITRALLELLLFAVLVLNLIVLKYIFGPLSGITSSMTLVIDSEIGFPQN